MGAINFSIPTPGRVRSLTDANLSTDCIHRGLKRTAGLHTRCQGFKPLQRQRTDVVGPKCKPFGQSCPPPSLWRHKQPKTTEVNGASGYGSDDMEAKIKNRKPPSLVQRVLAAFFYIVPWLDIVSIGYEYHRRFPTSIIFCVIPDPFFNIYYSSQFAPLIIFFLLFLSVVKNFKLHHFTRFHCMQAIVLDIVTMLFTLVRQYFPAEIRWSPVLGIYDMFAYNVCICTIVYCIFFALAGRYANITYVSESTYMQVEEGN